MKLQITENKENSDKAILDHNFRVSSLFLIYALLSKTSYVLVTAEAIESLA